MSHSGDGPDLEHEETYRIAHAGAPSDRMYLLVIAADGTTAYPLPARGEITLGRSGQCDVRIDDPSISRRHAAIAVGDGVRIRDLGSANGVFVQRRRLAADEWADFAPGDVIEAGAVVLVVHHGAPAGTLRSASGAAPRAPLPPSGDVASPRDDRDRDAVVVRDPSMQRVFELVRRVASSTISVLVLGETGVGKEIVAEALHRYSPRAPRPLVKLNCAALSPSLLESELFGHEKGAFTGAAASKPGLLETAEGGTVFLDEVGELPPTVQVKLLRVLEERRVLRVGGLRPIAIDVRFVAATHRDLHAEIAAGRFRQDLYFRLNGVSVTVPPLRARPAEIAALAAHFVARARADRAAGPAPEFAPAALALLARYAWPGNVRELRNVAERAALLCDGPRITPEHLPAEIAAGDAAAPDARGAAPAPATPPAPRTEQGRTERARALHSELEALERARIIEALEQCGGNQTRAAERLGVARRTIVKWIREYNIPRPRAR